MLLLQHLLTALVTVLLGEALTWALTGFRQHQAPQRGSSLLIRTETLEAVEKIWAKIPHDNTFVQRECMTGVACTLVCIIALARYYIDTDSLADHDQSRLLDQQLLLCNCFITPKLH